MDNFFADFPALAPPPGVVSNFDNPKTLAPSLVGVNVTFITLMVIAVAIRIYSRGFIVHALGWDDYTCALASFCSLVHTTMVLEDVHLQFGRHLWDIRALWLTPSHTRAMASLSVIYAFAIFFIKLSICLLYIRIFSIQRAFRYFVYAGMLFCALVYTTYVSISIATIVQCEGPLSFKYPVCSHAQSIVIVFSVIGVATDVYILALPISPILHLKLRRRQKIGLLGVFLSGLIACAVSIARMVYAAIRIHNPDTLYFAALTTELTIVELNVAIITSCMAAMPQFFSQSRIFKAATYRQFKTRLFGESTKTGSSGAAVLPRDANGSKTLLQNRNNSVQRADYLELQELPRAHTVAGPGEIFHEEIDSGMAVAKTTTFDVISGANTERYNTEHYGKP